MSDFKSNRKELDEELEKLLASIENEIDMSDLDAEEEKVLKNLTQEKNK